MRKKILRLIEETLNLGEGTLNEKTVIDEVEGWDSLAYVLIIGDMESSLGISIPLDEAAQVTTIEELFEKAGV